MSTRSMFLLSVCTAAMLAGPEMARADIVNLGFISFDGFIPGDSGLPGVNEFSINNLTGDSGLGGFALPPDFSVFTFLTFKGSQLTLSEASGTEVFNLGDLGPGTTISDLITASTDVFSATFSATLDQTVLSLSDGSTFTVASAAIQAIVLSSSPPLLNVGDFALITASNAPAAVPEPASWTLVIVCSLPLVYLRIKRKR